ncbi:unnamed protein product, partial [marine sediment metagenome]
MGAFMSQFKFHAIHGSHVGIIIYFSGYLVGYYIPMKFCFDGGASIGRCRVDSGFYGIEFKVPSFR